ncbi:MAG: GNAT family N-acetyltransferase [Cypionkella sp.]|nr:GNAT family N-acetyltransferase [Cypionkella sp.]
MSAVITIRSVQPADRAEWDVLYQGYAAFYKTTQTPEMRDRVWSWLHDPAQQSEGLVAVAADGTLIGLAHFRAFARPLAASTGGYLDDLFVSPAARGSGAADALINRLAAIGKERGWTVIRWITADDNYRGRAVYDRLASKTPWLTYDIKL